MGLLEELLDVAEDEDVDVEDITIVAVTVSGGFSDGNTVGSEKVVGTTVVCSGSRYSTVEVTITMEVVVEVVVKVVVDVVVEVVVVVDVVVVVVVVVVVMVVVVVVVEVVMVDLVVVVTTADVLPLYSLVLLQIADSHHPELEVSSVEVSGTDLEVVGVVLVEYPLVSATTW